MGVNRFIDYANPMYWAKMLRKGGIPKRKPYSFTVKIADYTTDTGHLNEAKIMFNNQEICKGKKSTGQISGIYDASAPMPFNIQFESKYTSVIDEEGEVTSYTGYSLSPSTAWKIEAKDGTKYEGVIGEGTKTIGDLFSLIKTRVGETETEKGTFYNKFELTNDYDCVIFDGCTITFYPEFEKIEGIYLVAYSVYEASEYGESNVPVIEDYTFDIRFNDEAETEYKKIRAKWLKLPERGEKTQLEINLKPSDYIQFHEYDLSSTQAEAADVAAGYWNTEGTQCYSGTLCKKPGEGETFDPHVKLILTYSVPEQPEAGVIYLDLNKRPSADTRITFEANFEKKESALHTVKAHSTDSQKGLVSINDSVMSKNVTTYVKPNTEKAITFKAIPATGTYEFKGWSQHGSTEIIKTDNPYTERSGEAGGTTELDAHFSAPEASFTIRKKNYYDASITIEKENSVGSWESLCQNYYDWSSTLLPEGQKLHYGDKLKITMNYDDEGFQDPKLRIGNTIYNYENPITFMLDETTADAQYELTLKDGYGAVFAEVYPDKYKWSEENPVKVSVYTMEKTDEISDRFKAAKIPFTDSRWSKQIEESKGWQTKAINLKNDAGENIEYWVGFEFHPNKSGETEKAPFLSSWRDAVLAQSRGGAYKFVHNNTLSLALEGRYKFARLSCNLVDGTEKTAKLGTFKIASFTTDGNGTEVPLNASAQLVMHDSQTLLSMFEESPKCIFDRTYDNLVRISSVSQTLTHESKSYTFNAGGCYAGPQELVKDWFIDGGGMGTVTFTDVVKSTENPVITLYLNYNETPQTEEEFLKSNIAEAKEKLVDAIEALEKDYDDGKEDVIEETPVKDEPDTDEADVAEAVLATEPAEDKE